MNRKRHTTLKNNIRRTCLFVPLFLIFGCAKTSTPPVNIPPPPPQRESVLPHLNKIHSGIDGSIKTNIQIEDQIKKQKQEVLNQRLDISEAIIQAEKLKNKIENNESVFKQDIISLIDVLKKVETRNLFLEKQNEELETKRKEQAEILRITKDDAVITYKKLIDKENEVSELRTQNGFLSSSLSKKNVEVENLKKQIEKEKVKSAKSSVYKNWVIGIVAAFVLWTILKNVLMIYFPMTKFRI